MKSKLDYEQYVPRTGSHFDWMVAYSEKITEPILAKYIYSIEKKLQELKPTEKLYFKNVETKDPELLIKSICQFVEHKPEYHINKDWQFIMKTR
ncbi:MAG: hypothetical protein PHV20_12450 [Bacteroidales bacterium]|nr:hypothetical protein [Bacteroidales bacterium]